MTYDTTVRGWREGGLSCVKLCRCAIAWCKSGTVRGAGGVCVRVCLWWWVVVVVEACVGTAVEAVRDSHDGTSIGEQHSEWSETAAQALGAF